MSLLDWLDHLDKALFVLIQQDSDHSVLDKIMPLMREPFTWVPLYAFILFYILFKHRNKAFSFIILSVLTFAITDSLTAQVLKPLFGRLRPCLDPEMQTVVRTLVDCAGRWSMPSNHAANHFGLAAFWFYSLRSITGKKWHWLWFWAGAVCYAQVYVGKHYPLDVFVGAVTGWLTGLGMYRLFVFWEKRQNPRPPLFRREYGSSI
jgi:membrane-associated phospholipid phosphatase